MQFSNRFKLVHTAFGQYLANRDNPRDVDLVSAKEIFAELKRMSLDPYAFSYYVFYKNEAPNYILVTKTGCDFNEFEDDFGERKEYNLVDGALFNASTKRFVDFEGISSHNQYFYNFVIYDGGMPNVIFDKYRNEYVVVYEIREGKFGLTKSATIPIVVTYINNNNKFYRNRAIFLSNGYGEMFILKDDISLVKYAERAKFEQCIYCKKNKAKKAPKKSEERKQYLSSTLISDDSCVVINSPFGEFGEKVFLNLSNPIELDYNKSFFDCQVIEPDCQNLNNHLIVKVLFEKDDFTNGTSYYDVSSRAVYLEKP